MLSREHFNFIMSVIEMKRGFKQKAVQRDSQDKFRLFERNEKVRSTNRYLVMIWDVLPVIQGKKTPKVGYTKMVMAWC